MSTRGWNKAFKLKDRENILIEYSEQFRTQGNRDGKHWFLGIEEGGHATEAEVDSTLAHWDRKGRRENVALNEPELTTAKSKWFDGNRPGGPAIQKTWNAQIRVLLSMQGLPDDRESVRLYQSMAFGTPTGDTCLMELLPLPNPGLDKWIYSDMSALPQFSSREAFIAHALEARVANFLELVSMHQPRTVVCLSYGYRNWLKPYLENIEEVQAGVGSSPGKAMIGNLGDTIVAITYHPNYAMSAPNKWYKELGQLIADRGDDSPRGSFRVQLQLPLDDAA